MDTEALVKRAQTDLSRQRRINALMRLVTGVAPRKATALILSVFESNRTAPWKRELADEADHLVRALEELKTEPALKVLRALTGRIANTTELFTAALVRLGDRDAVPHLLTLIEENNEDAVIAAAAKAIGILGDVAAVMPLQRRGTRECKLAIAAIQARVGESERGALTTSDVSGGELSKPRPGEPE